LCSSLTGELGKHSGTLKSKDKGIKRDNCKA